MRDENSYFCPIPHLGYCVRERCNFWDEDREQCTGECFGDFQPLESSEQPQGAAPCTIYWCEDND